MRCKVVVALLSLAVTHGLDLGSTRPSYGDPMQYLGARHGGRAVASAVQASSHTPRIVMHVPSNQTALQPPPSPWVAFVVVHVQGNAACSKQCCMRARIGELAGACLSIGSNLLQLTGAAVSALCNREMQQEQQQLYDLHVDCAVWTACRAAPTVPSLQMASVHVAVTNTAIRTNSTSASAPAACLLQLPAIDITWSPTANITAAAAAAVAANIPGSQRDVDKSDAVQSAVPSSWDSNKQGGCNLEQHDHGTQLISSSEPACQPDDIVASFESAYRARRWVVRCVFLTMLGGIARVVRFLLIQHLS